jgi:hypothetical protein
MASIANDRVFVKAIIAASRLVGGCLGRKLRIRKLADFQEIFLAKIEQIS